MTATTKLQCKISIKNFEVAVGIRCDLDRFSSSSLKIEKPSNSQLARSSSSASWLSESDVLWLDLGRRAEKRMEVLTNELASWLSESENDGLERCLIFQRKEVQLLSPNYKHQRRRRHLRPLPIDKESVLSQVLAIDVFRCSP